MFQSNLCLFSSGFPRGLTHRQIIPLSCLLIVSHELLNSMYEKGEIFNIEEFLDTTKELYSSGNFKKIHTALKKMGS